MNRPLTLSRSAIWPRALICLLHSGAFTWMQSDVIVASMLLLALAGLRIPRGGEMGATVSLFLFIQAAWLLLAATSYWLNLSPLAYTDIRSALLTDFNWQIVILCAAQFLFLCNAVQWRVEGDVDLRRWRAGRAIWVAYGLMVVTTLLINREGVLLSGGYGTTERAEYWSGLPLVFVVASALWILLQRRYGFPYFLGLNAVIGWWLLSGNRSEVLILFLLGNFLFLRSFMRSRGGGAVQLLGMLAAISIGFAIFSFVGMARVHGAAEVGVSNVAGSVGSIVGDGRLQFQTFGSSIYSALVAVEFASNQGFRLGKTFAGQLLNSLPSFIPLPWERYQDISRGLLEYQILGGLGLYGEAYINFGLLGPVLVGGVLAAALVSVLRAAPASMMASWFLISLCLYSPRIYLYGFVYLYKLLLVFLGLYVVYKVLVRRSRSLPRMAHRLS